MPALLPEPRTRRYFNPTGHRGPSPVKEHRCAAAGILDADPFNERGTTPDPMLPAIVPSATWQPPFTPSHSRFRPALNGVAIPGAVAARAGKSWGWVRFVDNDGHLQTKHGEVTIVAGDGF